ncbi:MAG: UDP-glucose 4-epimerase GalE [Phycisphaerales bacterium]|nr:UDP-glucose 4-epimerase GalE [Phycisphaerales bacterium]
MKVLVTGGAGYVGSHCVRRLVDAGHNITVLDNLCAGHADALPKGVPLVRADLADAQTLSEVLDRSFDAVMHFAAFLDVGESVRDPLKYYQNNVVGTIGLLRVMQLREIRRFVFSSTCATYGVPEQVPITEDLPQAPINPYGHSKLAIEWALRDSAEGWGLGSCALRYFNASGAARDGSIGEDHDPEIHLIPLVLQVALGQRESIKIFGTDYPTPDGTCIRDYIHVEDLAEAHLRALEHTAKGGFNAFNVGTGVGTSVRQIIEAACAVTDCAIPAVETERRPGDPPQLYADPSKLRDTLGWKPEYTDITAIIETAWRWHRTHPNGYES